jgi:hypothetical protein
MDSLKFHLSSPCLSLPRSAGLTAVYSGDPPAGQGSCGHLLPPWTPHAVHLCLSCINVFSGFLRVDQVEQTENPKSLIGRRYFAIKGAVMCVYKEQKDFVDDSPGQFHHQADAVWIGIRGLLWGHNDTPCGRPTPRWPICHPGYGRPSGVLGVFSYY